LSRVYTRLSR